MPSIFAVFCVGLGVCMSNIIADERSFCKVYMGYYETHVAIAGYKSVSEDQDDMKSITRSKTRVICLNNVKLSRDPLYVSLLCAFFSVCVL
ncbi:uncharacterized protein BDZ83DRAFT_92152 [Colletotrichum acutatum]|uniref:Uncharacterized protein n=1 Tax=Glomerella acutata TaxID=27357 RepID=A0AAD8UAT5_GLOAC|nr:uncharacterized protein BDZ83DRAFT_92152 [Colletotrichum acutatum]KAK1712966.1 hypothetical protein BDZ83DRAFT_92152 [Colletotrichum acutatum]